MRLRTELIRKIAVIQLRGRQDLIAGLEKKTLPLIKTAARHRNKIVHGVNAVWIAQVISNQVTGICLVGCGTG
jgi:hypothetical protein